MFSYRTWLIIDIFVVVFQILQLGLLPSSYEDSAYQQSPLDDTNSAVLLLRDLYWAWIAALFAWVMALSFVSSLPIQYSIRFAPYLALVSLVQLFLTVHYRWNGRWTPLFTYTNEIMLSVWLIVYSYFSLFQIKQ